MRHAACRGLTHLFFPSSAERPQARERREATARQVCADCRVRSLPRVRPDAPRVRVLGWRERGRAPRRRLPPDRPDRRPRPRRLIRARPPTCSTSASSAAPTSTSSPRRPPARAGRDGPRHRLRRARRRQGPQPGGRRRRGRRTRARSSPRSATTTPATGSPGVLDAAGIDTALVQRIDDTPTGRALITVDDRRENSIVVVPGPTPLIAATPLPAAACRARPARGPGRRRDRRVRRAAAAGRDDRAQPGAGRRRARRAARRSSIVVPNEHELEPARRADALIAAGVELVITTLGGDGVEIVTPTRRRTVPPFAVDADRHDRRRRRLLRRARRRLAAGDAARRRRPLRRRGRRPRHDAQGAVPSIPTRPTASSPTADSRRSVTQQRDAAQPSRVAVATGTIGAKRLDDVRRGDRRARR